MQTTERRRPAGCALRAFSTLATAVVVLTGCSPVADQSQQPVPTVSTPRPQLAAKYSTDLAKVCTSASAFANVAPYRSGSPPKVVAFAKTPERGAVYVQQATFQGRTTSFEPPTEFGDISVVVCVTAVPGSEGASKQCPKDHPVFALVSYRATVDLYAAATGEKLGSAGTIDVPAGSCPIVVGLYDPVTLKSYPVPAVDSIIDATATYFGATG